MLGKVRKWGNSQGLRLTKSVLEKAGLNVGDEVRVSVSEGRIVVASAARVRGKYDLETLLSTMPDGHQPEELSWGPRAGKEAW